MSTVTRSWRTLVALCGALVLILGMAVSPASAVTLDEVSSLSERTEVAADPQATPAAEIPEIAAPELEEQPGLTSEVPDRPDAVAKPTIAPDAPISPDAPIMPETPQVQATEPAAAPQALKAPAAVETGSISGQVSVPTGVNPRSVSVSVYTDVDTPEASVKVSSSGTYTLSKLAPGSYKMFFDSTDETVSPQWWENASDFGSATWITVVAGQNTSKINVTMSNGGSISGMVTLPAGVNTLNAYVAVYDAANEWVASSGLEPEGSYEVGGNLPTGSYKVQFRTYSANVSPQWWNNASDIDSATPVNVNAGENTPNIDATLTTGGSISGAVTLPYGVRPQSISVGVYDLSRRWVATAFLAADGSYKVSGLASGSYRVKFDSLGATVASQWWENATTQRLGTPVDVISGQDTSNINVTLLKGGSISGQVTVPEGVTPRNFYVGVYDSFGTEVRYAYLDATGTYTVAGLYPGTYRVKFDSLGAAIAPQWWDGAADIDSATPVQVADQQDTPNVDGFLDGRVALDSSIPTINGSLKVEGVLTVDPGAWTSDATFMYQWLANGTAISGATGSTYKLTDSQYNKTMTVRVTGSKSGYTTTSQVSEPTEKVTAGTLKRGTPKITGDVQVNKVLKAEPGTWTSGTKFKYQWLVDGVELEGATKSTFTLTIDNLGKKISVKVTGSKTGYVTASKTSMETVQVAEGDMLSPVPSITGTAQVGKKLSTNRGIWASGSTRTYQWFADGEAIAGATDTSYTLTADMVGKQITFAMTGSKPGYATVVRTSEPTAKVAAGALLAPVPAINGTVEVGRTLSSARGIWSTGTTFEYRWFADGKVIEGAANYQLKLTPAELGKKITVTVTGSKAGYATTSRTSAATVKVAPGTLTSPVPTLSGTIQVGKTVYSSRGYWSVDTTYDYQWSADGKVIEGAKGTSLLLTPAELGKKITVTVTGSKPGYATVSRTSEETTPVAPGALYSAVPTIRGTLQVGKTLSSGRGIWAAGTEFTYQWLADGVAIYGATDWQYTLTRAEVGKRMTVTVTGSKPGYETTPQTSEPTDVVFELPLSSSVPSIHGVAQVGNTLNSTRGLWEKGAMFDYQWHANGVAITGATDTALSLTHAEIGKQITVTVTGSKTGHETVALTSDPTIEVAALG